VKDGRIRLALPHAAAMVVRRSEFLNPFPDILRTTPRDKKTEYPRVAPTKD